MNKIGILTGGGDAPGLNAVIRAVVKTAHHDYACEVVGILDGFDGLLEESGTLDLTPEQVRGILPRGGTILGTANRGNPFARKIERDGVEIIEDVSDDVVECIHALELDALIVVGGDGTLRISYELFEKGCPVIGVPKTIDNDIGGTDVSFGFDTAVSTATEAFDRLHTTAESHHRVMVLELMGRDAGFIALHAGIAGGADVILIPEIPYTLDCVFEKILGRAKTGRHFSIVSVAEGAYPAGGAQTFALDGDAIYIARLGGVGESVAAKIAEQCEMETRVTVLGHLQRGGSPTAFDRWLATRYGSAAVHLAAMEAFGQMVCLQGQEIQHIALEQALAHPKRVNLEGDAIKTARSLDICLGEVTA
ncbi:MAG: ATP-dependent 6-phosphofructokinase [Anaerolineales bacterium]|nr:MAG: ATP-dependent 6-phosphofructokinase [Anaerolineales bacterium]